MKGSFDTPQGVMTPQIENCCLGRKWTFGEIPEEERCCHGTCIDDLVEKTPRVRSDSGRKGHGVRRNEEPGAQTLQWHQELGFPVGIRTLAKGFGPTESM